MEYVYNLNLDTGLPLPLTPPLSLLAGIEYTFPDFISHVSNVHLFSEARLVSAQNRVDRNERMTDGYSIFEAGIGWNVELNGQPIKFQLSGQNLPNTFYFNHLSRYRLLNLPEQGRNITFSVKVPISIRSQKN